MNARKFLSVPLLSTLVLFGMSGCTDDELVDNPSIPTGKGIVFGASANYADEPTRVGGSAPSTRTEYGDYEYQDGKKVSQAINWLTTDKVEIYSPKSHTIQQQQYGITNISSEKKNQAYLLSSGEDGLHWDNSSSKQAFYAVYPSPASMSNDAVRNMVSFNNGVLTGYVPVNQAHTITKGGATGWTAKPVMDYLYMSAVTDADVPADGAENDGVSLDFVPLTTTLEVTINGVDNSAPIVQMNVVAEDGENIAGSFTCDLVNGSKDEDGYPECQYVSSSTVRNMVTVNTYYNDGGTQRPMNLASGESVTFNVFLLPHKDLTNLRLRIVGLNTTGKNMTLAENTVPITLHPHKKTCVTVNAPQFTTGEANNWITALDDNVIISQLSIPGTANSFSYNYRGNNTDMYRTQTVDFETQWNSGIRCFELKLPNNTGNGDLGSVNLQCNGQDLGITFEEAVKQIWAKVSASEGEFAMIIPFFESQGGRENNVVDFANDLNTFFDNHSEYKYVTYGSRTTVGEAAKSLMFVARITSEEDGADIIRRMPTPHEGVFVSQWGSLKDNWARRGYMMNGIKVQNYATTATYRNPSVTPTMEYYMMNGNTTTGNNHTNDSFTPSSFPVKDVSQIDYSHPTTRSNGSEGKAYIQDWSRVIPETHNFYMSRNSKGWTGPLGGNYGTNHFCYWQESYNEKYADVWRTFELAIKDNSNPSEDTPFYINSLDGYFADWDDNGSEGNSAYPFVEGGVSGYDFLNGGGRGDIATYAERINNDFYNNILTFGEDNIYGPMNVVLLDRVYVGDGGTYLPSVIINNNFRFPLLTNGSTTTNASYNNGGNAISNK